MRDDRIERIARRYAATRCLLILPRYAIVAAGQIPFFATAADVYAALIIAAAADYADF